MKITIVAFDEFTDLDVFLPWDLLSRVAWDSVGKHEDWQVKIVGTAESHVSMSGMRIPTMGRIEETADADAVLFASGKGVQKLIDDPDYLARFRLNPERQLIGSMCSGALLLAALGLLDGVPATTYPTSRDTLYNRFGVDVLAEPFVCNGHIATAAGCLAGVDLASWMIRELAGQEMVDRVLESVQPVQPVRA